MSLVSDSGDAMLSKEPIQMVMVPSSRPSTTGWIIITLLAVIATALFMRWDEAAWTRAAFAQVAGAGAAPAGARGIYAFTGQLTGKSYGLFMMDVDSGTIWCYEFQRGLNNEPQMKLVAARSWIYDRYLEEFNVADPIPSEVKALVQQQQSNRQTGAGSTRPAAALPVNPVK